MPHYLEPIPNWTSDEQPRMAGSPSTPYHSPAVRLAYAFVGVLIAITGGLGNGMVLANLPQIQGELGLTPIEGAWLPAAWVMVNVSSNLILFKCRQQFGIRRFAELGLMAYVLATVLQLAAHSYPMTIFARAVTGFASAPISALANFYIMQAFPKAKLGAGMCIALGVSQLATPLAWILSAPLLDIGEWHVLYVFELGLGLCSLAAVVVLKLPPGIRIKVFEPLDVLSFLLIAPALALIVAVLAQGRVQWWPDQLWMAHALIAALLLLLCAFYLEHHRERPLVRTRWLGTSGTIRFTLGALSIRLLLSEQTYAATGLMRTLGMGPDQLQSLYAVIFIGTLTGTIISALLFGPKTVPPLIAASVVLIIIGGLLDRHATNLTRPHDLYVSQFLVACAGGMFIGPLLLFGVNRALAEGADHMVTFIVLFSITQGVGGLAGPALFGTFQQYREREYSVLITAHTQQTDPTVALRLAIQTQVYSPVVTDPALRNALGVAALSQIATRESNVRAYNDVVVLNTVLAVIFLAWAMMRTFVLARVAAGSSTA
jgi:MFS family permease